MMRKMLIEKLIPVLFRIYMFPLNCVLRVVTRSYRKNLKVALLKSLYTGAEYNILSFFPKKLEDQKIKGTNLDFSDTAIIIQGPIVTRDDFTVNTVAMYRQYYNNVKIIVSTWADADSAAVERLEEAGAVVLRNEYPEFCGHQNINYQIVTSAAGMKEAKKIGVRYAVKTRADQRFYNPCALALLRGALQDGKIVMLGLGFCLREFFVSDFMSYGTIDDMLTMYGRDLMSQAEAEMLSTNKGTDRFKRFHDWIDQAEENCSEVLPGEYENAVIDYACPEVMLAYSYYLKKREKLGLTSNLGRYTDFLKNYVVTVDADSLGFYWLKYNRQVAQPTWFDKTGKFDAARWHSILLETEETGG